MALSRYADQEGFYAGQPRQELDDSMNCLTKIAGSVVRAFAAISGNAMPPPAFSAEYGMSLLEDSKFDQAAVYFQKHLKDSALAHYGLALTKFRKDTKDLSEEQAKEIIALFEEAISLAPKFADAYFMCAMAYNALAGIQLGSFTKHRTGLAPNGLHKADTFLVKAEQYFREATSLNPAFENIAKVELGTSQMLKGFSQKLRRSL